MSSIPQERLFQLEYYPSDFFYSTNKSDLPNMAGCEMLEYNKKDYDCSDSDIDAKTLKKCYELELCRNKDLIEKVYSKRDKHGTATVKYNDFSAKYKFEVIKFMNLLIGIIIAILFIHYNRV